MKTRRNWYKTRLGLTGLLLLLTSLVFIGLTGGLAGSALLANGGSVLLAAAPFSLWISGFIAAITGFTLITIALKKRPLALAQSVRQGMSLPADIPVNPLAAPPAAIGSSATDAVLYGGQFSSAKSPAQWRISVVPGGVSVSGVRPFGLSFSSTPRQTRRSALRDGRTVTPVPLAGNGRASATPSLVSTALYTVPVGNTTHSGDATTDPQAYMTPGKGGGGTHSTCLRAAAFASPPGAEPSPLKGDGDTVILQLSPQIRVVIQSLYDMLTLPNDKFMAATLVYKLEAYFRKTPEEQASCPLTFTPDEVNMFPIVARYLEVTDLEALLGAIADETVREQTGDLVLFMYDQCKERNPGIQVARLMQESLRGSRGEASASEATDLTGLSARRTASSPTPGFRYLTTRKVQRCAAEAERPADRGDAMARRCSF